jgi:hypothetical protein
LSFARGEFEDLLQPVELKGRREADALPKGLPIVLAEPLATLTRSGHSLLEQSAHQDNSFTCAFKRCGQF